MRSNRTHLVRVLLAAAMLAGLAMYGYYCGREWVAKWAFAHQTNFGINELILIAIPQADLSPQNTYLATDGEFAWQGEMVDVLHREIRADTLFIYGFRDAAETQLNQEAAWLYKDTNQPDSLPDPTTKRFKWFCPFVIPDRIVAIPVSGNVLPEFSPAFSYSCLRIQRPLLAVPSPPPDLS